MDYKRCDEVVKYTLFIGAVMVVISMFINNNFLLIAGFAVVFAGWVIKFKYWKCPYCKKRLPWTNKIKGRLPYKCTDCKCSIDMNF